jgi:hypothetical protein
VAQAQVYVGVDDNNSIAEYNATTGATINGSLVSGVTVSGLTGVITDILPAGNDLYATIVNVNNSGDIGAVGEYNATTGAPINSALVSGLSLPGGLAISGNDLYVLDRNSGTIGEYNATTGAAIHSTLVSGLNASPLSIAVSGNSLYVDNFNPGGSGSISVYNATTGASMNNALVSGLGLPSSIAISGNNLYVGNDESGVTGVGSIGEYNATTGAAIHNTLVSVPGFGPSQQLSLAIAVSGNDLYVANQGSGTIGEYDATTGAPIGSGTLVSGLNTSLDEPGAIGVEPVPEPATWATLGGGLGSLLVWRWRVRRTLA